FCARGGGYDGYYFAY
nr:immunoglobulin heavy chain junction region [Mus musculus]